MSTLYDLPMEANEAMRLYLSCFDQETGELTAPEEMAEWFLAELERLQNKKDESIEWILKTRGNAEANVTGIESEIARLKKRLDQECKTVDRMDALVRRFLPEIDKPMTISNWTVSYRSSKQTIIDDDSLVPSQFKKEKTTISIDKTEVKKAIESGEEVPGAHILEVQNLQIR